MLVNKVENKQRITGKAQGVADQKNDPLGATLKTRLLAGLPDGLFSKQKSVLG
jgi:hypothetical protein